MRYNTLSEYYDTVQQEACKTCSSCGACVAVCPNTEALGLDSAARQELPGRLMEALAGAAASDEVYCWVFGCNHCGACRSVCPEGLNPFLTNKILRRQLLQQREPHISSLHASLTSPQGSPLRTMDMIHQLVAGMGPHRWITAVPSTPEPVDTVVFLGCAGLMRPDITSALLDLLDDAGVAYVALGGTQFCCGSMFQFLGDVERFERHLRALLAALEAFQPREVVYLCAECLHNTTSAGAVIQDLPFAQTSATALLARHIGRLQFDRGLTARATLHDACSLGRLCGDCASPRALLQAVPNLELVEMAHAGLNGICCGAPGEMFVPGKNRAMQQQRIAEFRQAGSISGDDLRRLRNLFPAPAAGKAGSRRQHSALYRDAGWGASTVTRWLICRHRDVDGALQALRGDILSSGYNLEEFQQLLMRLFNAKTSGRIIPAAGNSGQLLPSGESAGSPIVCKDKRFIPKFWTV